jgi:hypothetical protein
MSDTLRELTFQGVEIVSTGGKPHITEKATKLICTAALSASCDSGMARELGIDHLVFDDNQAPKSGFNGIDLDLEFENYEVQFKDLNGKETVLTLSPVDLTRFVLHASDGYFGLSFNISFDNQYGKVASFLERNKTFTGQLLCMQMQMDLPLEEVGGTRVDMNSGAIAGKPAPAGKKKPAAKKPDKKKPATIKKATPKKK